MYAYQCKYRIKDDTSKQEKLDQQPQILTYRFDFQVFIIFIEEAFHPNPVVVSFLVHSQSYEVQLSVQSWLLCLILL
jgi:hypothetical protein